MKDKDFEALELRPAGSVDAGRMSISQVCLEALGDELEVTGRCAHRGVIYVGVRDVDCPEVWHPWLPADHYLLASIRLRRAEGPVAECVSKSFSVVRASLGEHFRLIQEAEKQLWRWGLSAPKETDAGYDKVDFQVTWGNGFSYNGRYDLIFGGTDGHMHFENSVNSRLAYFSGLINETHWSKSISDKHRGSLWNAIRI